MQYQDLLRKYASQITAIREYRKTQVDKLREMDLERQRLHMVLLTLLGCQNASNHIGCVRQRECGVCMRLAIDIEALLGDNDL